MESSVILISRIGVAGASSVVVLVDLDRSTLTNHGIVRLPSCVYSSVLYRFATREQHTHD
eukprot:1435167-Pyramimonas_sp.AAC.2